MYLQMHNFSDRGTKNPNKFMIVSSTALFLMITAVGDLGYRVPFDFCSHPFATLAMGYRGFSSL